jgi:hypothetical protein
MRSEFYIAKDFYRLSRSQEKQLIPVEFSLRKNLSDIYPQSQLRNFIDVIISLCITTCFGSYGPSSGEYNYYFKTLITLNVGR